MNDAAGAGEEPSEPRLERLMSRALQLAKRGEGHVEPNPMVGCVIAQEDQILGEGWHERFGGPHAEVNALLAAGERAKGATAVVTLEPCRHTGKTPPCTGALLQAGVARVVIAHKDPFPQVDGGGIATLEAAGVECLVGVKQAEAAHLLAPYLKLVQHRRPWVLAKWAMSLDGKIATRTLSSKWISGEASRSFAHEVRGKMDAVVVGAGTLVADDSLLTARPPGPRQPLRVVVADDRPLPDERRLWASLDEGPVLVATGSNYPQSEADRLRAHGVEVIRSDLTTLLDLLGERRLTNVLIEGGGKLLGRFLDQRLVDEALVFVAPKIIGGADAPGPVAGVGIEQITQAIGFDSWEFDRRGADLCFRGRVGR